MKKIFKYLALGIPLYLSLPANGANYYGDKEGEKTVESNDTSASASITTLKGTIGNMENYQPIEGVTLTITSFKGTLKKITKTDNNGKFNISLPVGIYKVRFEKEGYEPGTYESLTVKTEGRNNFGFLLYKN